MMRNHSYLRSNNSIFTNTSEFIMFYQNLLLFTGKTLSYQIFLIKSGRNQSQRTLKVLLASI